MRIAIFSFFSGCGLLDRGFEDAGFEVVFVNEYNPSFLKCYQHNRPVEPRYGYSTADVEDYLGVLKEQLKSIISEARKEFDFVGFIGGPPCPDFSIAGKGAGAAGSNGRLTGVYSDLINEFQPDFFLLENVKGLTMPKHRDYFEQLLGSFADRFYTEWQLVNALDYGVPQDRTRVIIQGFNRQKFTPMLINWDIVKLYNHKAIKKLPWPEENPFVTDSELPPPAGIAIDLTVEMWFKRNRTEQHPNSVNQIISEITADNHHLTLPEGGRRNQSVLRLHRWKYAPTLSRGHGAINFHPYKPRRLTVAEALAIQSAPIEFTLPTELPKTHLYQTVANAVPYLMAKGLAKTLRGVLK